MAVLSSADAEGFEGKYLGSGAGRRNRAVQARREAWKEKDRDQALQ